MKTASLLSNRYFRATALLVLTSIITTTASAAATPDEIVRWYESEGFSGHILVQKGDEILLDRQIGKASWQDGTPFTPDAPFYIGSVTKQMTAAAILKLQEQGKLSVEDKLSRFFPDVSHADKITLHQLLTHTSGLKNYTDLPEILALMTSDIVVTPGEILALVKDFPLDFEPGTDWSYCNTGYLLLGLVIEQISGKDLNSFWQEQFFRPQGMTGAGFTPDSRPGDEPKGHTWDRDYANVHQHNGHMSWAHAAGGVYASVYDMMKWSNGLHGGQLLTEKSYQAMTTPVLQDYGYGVLIKNMNGKRLIGHGGGMPGFTCQILALPADDLHVIVLTNLSDPNSMAGDASIRLLQAFAGNDTELPEPIVEAPLTADEMTAYTGTYSVESIGMSMKVFTEDGKLYLHPEGQQEARLLFTENDTFYLRIERIRIVFSRGDNGRATGFVLTQQGNDYTAVRSE